MRIGYACQTVDVPQTKLRSCILRNANEIVLTEIISHNLDALENIIDYNIDNNIKLFRISSDLIPFASSPVNTINWMDLFSNKLSAIGNKILKNGIRVSMHPGQYTVLNSLNDTVAEKAAEDLSYHEKVLSSLGIGCHHKIVLHIGGIYGDKKNAIDRFISNYKYLDKKIKQRLIIENDDRSYNIGDVLKISEKLNIPVVFDNLHNQINPFDKTKDAYYWINICKETWDKKHGTQKVHYAQQDLDKKIGAHSNSIRINEFMKFYDGLDDDEIDIMLEVKDKNLSAIKCIECINQKQNKT